MKIDNSILTYTNTISVLNPSSIKTLSDQIKSRQPSIAALETADHFFDLGSPTRLNFLTLLNSDDNNIINDVTQIIQKYVNRNIVGYEFLEVNKQPYKSFITTRIGDRTLYSARLYKNKKIIEYYI